MKMIKENWKGAATASFFFLCGLLAIEFENLVGYFAEEGIEEYEIYTQLEELDLFAQTSGIIGHKIENGKIYLRYRTCNPPNHPAIGEYHYQAYINGVPTNSIPNRSEFEGYNIKDWWIEEYCTKGWWGETGFDLPKRKMDEYYIRVVWKWRIRANDVDVPTHHTIMEYYAHVEDSTNTNLGN